MAVTGTVDLISETTGKRIANALENYQLDGTAKTYRKEMRRYFINNGAEDADPEKLTAIVDKWYSITRDDWCGWVEFYQPDVSAVSTGTKGGDNEGLICEPSTDTVEGQDDYAGLPLFACVDCNWEVDEETLRPVITAIDGITNNFERYNPKKYVGVLQMSGYYCEQENADTYIRGYSATSKAPFATVEPLPDAVDMDGTVRSWVVHAKYVSHTTDGMMTSCAGLIPTAYLSHNTLHTLSQVNGSQYSGYTTAEDFFMKLMSMIKYGSLTLDGIMNGCVSMSYQYYAQVSEEGVNRVILTNANAGNLEIGMSVLIGSYTSGADRATAASYSITGNGGAKITAIEDYDGSNMAVYVDCDTFDAVSNGSAAEGTTVLWSFHWPTGSTDCVLGNDGSPISNTDQKHPCKLQGIEFMNGCYEIVADVILQMFKNADGNYYYQPNIVRKSAQQGTSISGNYEATGLLCLDEVTSSTWGYIKKLSYSMGVLFPTLLGGSSSTYTRDAFYQAAQNETMREWLARGALSAGSNAGVSCMSGGSALSASNWGFASRLSANGNRGEWAE